MDVGALARQQTEFVLDLYRKIANRAPEENTVLSPISISLALSMVAAGAKGPTLEQIANSIKIPHGDLMHKFSTHLANILQSDGEQGLELSCANRIWVDQTIQLKPTFQKLLKDSYGAEAASVDFRHKVTPIALSSLSLLWMCRMPLYTLRKTSNRCRISGIFERYATKAS